MLELRPRVVWVEGSKGQWVPSWGHMWTPEGLGQHVWAGGWQSRHLGQCEWSDAEPAVSRGVLEQGGLSHFHSLCFHS